MRPNDLFLTLIAIMLLLAIGLLIINREDINDIQAQLTEIQSVDTLYDFEGNQFTVGSVLKSTYNPDITITCVKVSGKVGTFKYMDGRLPDPPFNLSQDEIKLRAWIVDRR